MSPLVRNPLACLLATAIFSIAAFGHAWHDHGGCESAECVAANQRACPCGHEHPPQVGAEPDAPTEGLSATVGCSSPHDCVACELLAKVSQGDLGEARRAFEAKVQPVANVYERPLLVERVSLLYGPRGPPATSLVG